MARRFGVLSPTLGQILAHGGDKSPEIWITFSQFFKNYYHTIFHRYGVEIRGPNLFDFSHLLIVFPSLNMVQNCKDWLNRKPT